MLILASARKVLPRPVLRAFGLSDRRQNLRRGRRPPRADPATMFQKLVSNPRIAPFRSLAPYVATGPREPPVQQSSLIELLMQPSTSTPWQEPRPFLQTHRSIGALARELERVTDEIERRLELVPPSDGKREVRRSPTRCAAQLGPVSLTVSWVRSRDDLIENGRMMVMHWRGAAGGAGPWMQEEATMGRPQRAAGPKAKAVSVLGQRDLVPDATSPDDWTWRDELSDERLDSLALAAWCVETLLINRKACPDPTENA